MRKHAGFAARTLGAFSHICLALCQRTEAATISWVGLASPPARQKPGMAAIGQKAEANILRARAARAADFLQAAGPKGGKILAKLLTTNVQKPEAKLLTTRAEPDDYKTAPGPRGEMVKLNDLPR